MLSPDQIEFFNEQGYLRIPQLFAPREIDALEHDLTFLTEKWAEDTVGWIGPWRKVLMDADTEKKSRLIHLHDLHFYSEAWLRGVTGPRVAEAMGDLLGPDVELHHTTLHLKPPETGHPFPMHQDSAFYLHQDHRYIDLLVHLDDTCHANGEIRFLPGSHKAGHLPHIEMTPDGPCTPHLPTDRYRLEDTIAVPAQRGDAVVFNYYTIHGSYVNTTSKVRRLVRVGYRNPANPQLAGQSVGRPGVMVRGLRKPTPGQKPLTIDAVK